MKAVIANKEGVVFGVYEGEPNQSRYGGPWGDPLQFDHIALPEGMIDDASALSVVDGQIIEDSEKKTIILAARQKAAVTAAVLRAKQACADLEVEFMAENSILGIKQDGLATKQEVATKLAGVSAALKTGDPDLVIAALKAIPTEEYDGKYITAERLLAAGNKIRVAMGLPVVTGLAGL